jgi:coenzyme F420 hydrogenase subunit beta
LLLVLVSLGKVVDKRIKKINPMPSKEVNVLFNTVVDGGYCIGCGACATVNDSEVKMELDEYERFQATLTLSSNQSSSSASVLAVCPFSEDSLTEDQIAQEQFGNDCKYDNHLGYYVETYAGYVHEENFRDRGSSGGFGTWITIQLLRERLIDGVIHIHQRVPTPEDGRLFKYQISLNEEDVCNGAKSRYYPIEMSEIIQIIRDRPGQYAVVGIPCFIKAVRLLMRQDPIIAKRIKFCIGLVCGHLKSAAFAKMFAWQVGIEPNNLISFDFRKKLPDNPANHYGIEATGKKDGKAVTYSSSVRDLYGHDWGLGFFKYKACDYCDDVVAETADISVGDAWLPQYQNDSQGTNVVIVRNPVLYALVEKARASKQLKLDLINSEDVINSQRAGFGHRRDGLAYRLYLTDQKGEWRPPKRVEPQANHIDTVTQERFRLRSLISQLSHKEFHNAVKAGQFSIFQQGMDPMIRAYRETYLPPKSPLPKSPLWKRAIRRFKKFFIEVLK